MRLSRLTRSCVIPNKRENAISKGVPFSRDPQRIPYSLYCWHIFPKGDFCCRSTPRLRTVEQRLRPRTIESITGSHPHHFSIDKSTMANIPRLCHKLMDPGSLHLTCFQAHGLPFLDQEHVQYRLILPRMSGAAVRPLVEFGSSTRAQPDIQVHRCM